MIVMIFAIFADIVGWVELRYTPPVSTYPTGFDQTTIGKWWGNGGEWWENGMVGFVPLRSTLPTLQIKYKI